MATSTLKITFPQNLIVGSTVSFNFKRLSTGVVTPVTFTWVTTRVNPYEVQITAPMVNRPGRSSAIAFKNAFELDEPDYPITINLLGLTSTSVVISSNDPDITFTGGTSTIREGQSSLVTFEITREAELGVINISGLENDNYLINNEIWVGITSSVGISKYIVSFTNLNNGNTSKPFILFPINSSSNINIQPIIKSLFDYPYTRNQNTFKINISSYVGDILNNTSEINKNFIRGGNRTDDTNQYLTLGDNLSPVEILPIWTGYPAQLNFLDFDGTIQNRNIDDVQKEYRKVKVCDSLYFKFLNQKGGISNWLFEGNYENESNQNAGTFIRNNKVSDLGNESEQSLNVYSKIPKQYYPLIQDLIISPEIYVWKDMVWRRVISGRNTTEYDNSKKAYSFKGKFIFENRFNPTILWSN